MSVVTVKFRTVQMVVTFTRMRRKAVEMKDLKSNMQSDRISPFKCLEIVY